MNRRDFLKFGSLLSAFAFLFTGPAELLARAQVEAVANGKKYRGTHNGKIHVSADEGKNWQLHSNFGPEHAVQGIFTGSDGRVYARLGFKQYNFYLVLASNEVAWLSQPL